MISAVYSLKTVALAVLLTSLVGCGAVEPREEQAMIGDVGEAKTELNVCLYGNCSAGYHTYDFITDPNCGSTGFGTDNARDCRPNLDPAWEQCESTCPSGYAITQVSTNHPYCCLSSCTYAPRYRCTKI